MQSPQLIYVKYNTLEPLATNEEGNYCIFQHERWSIRVLGIYEGKVVLKRESNKHFLLKLRSHYNNIWDLPNYLNFEEKTYVTGAGKITALLLDKKGQELASSALEIVPSNIKSEDLDKMIQEIGQLALSTASCVYREIKDEKYKKSGNEGAKVLMIAQDILDLYKVFKSNWKLLMQKPLKSINHQLSVVNLHQTKNSPRNLIKAKTQPERRRVLGFTTNESIMCVENECLCYILDKYLITLAQGLIDTLQSLHITIEDIDTDLIIQQTKPKRSDDHFQDFKNLSVENAKKLKRTRINIKNEIEQAILDLKKCYYWAINKRYQSFLKNIKTPQKLPLVTTRLMGSFAYIIIFNQFLKCKSHSNLQPEILELFEYIYSRPVHTTWRIYEIWCFVKLYSAFILYAGFKPVDNTDLFKQLRNSSQGLTIPSDRIFKLQSITDDHKTQININFWYDTLYQQKKPDIRLEISINGETPKQYCFDAKYRNYEAQGYKTLVDDILGVARDKYLVGLHSKASFILHTDQKIDSYWGEIPFSKYLSTQKHGYNLFGYKLFNKCEMKEHDLFFNGHQYGAINFYPNQNIENNLKKIIRLLLQYHDSLKTICLSCQHQLQIGTEIETSWLPSLISKEKLVQNIMGGQKNQNTIFYCSCSKCGDFWVRSYCLKNHHTLLKFENSFHQKSDPNSYKWSYDCPVCGSQLCMKNF
jgi:hypothetical protein